MGIKNTSNIIIKRNVSIPLIPISEPKSNIYPEWSWSEYTTPLGSKMNYLGVISRKQVEDINNLFEKAWNEYGSLGGDMSRLHINIGKLLGVESKTKHTLVASMINTRDMTKRLEHSFYIHYWIPRESDPDMLTNLLIIEKTPGRNTYSVYTSTSVKNKNLVEKLIKLVIPDGRIDVNKG